jgi:hypothetical protein
VPECGTQNVKPIVTDSIIEFGYRYRCATVRSIGADSSMLAIA